MTPAGAGGGAPSDVAPDQRPAGRSESVSGTGDSMTGVPSVLRRPRSRVPLISAIAVGCVTALLVAVLATSKDASTSGTVSASPLQNQPAPEISGPTLGGGGGALSAYKGKWVVVNFFASWCVPCQQEQADLVRFQNAHAAGDAVIFGVRFDDPDTGPIQDLMNKSGGKWPIVDDPNAKITYSVTGPPESFLVSPGGIVLAHIVGPITNSKLEELLDQVKLVVSTPAQVGPATSTP
jgi:cytochrome c biogenesis protein CcmG/thiol:disulfide interchange protein DsbE